MAYEMKSLSCDPSRLKGLSERLIARHYENNYGGAVKRQRHRLAVGGARCGQRPHFVVNGLKREELVAMNSMILHELYSDGLGGDGGVPDGDLGHALARDFGSRERWQAEFMAMGKALAGGSGWVLLTYSPRDGRLLNQWASDHTQTLAGAIPLLALDMYEHSYHLDYGAKAGAYVDAFMHNVRWEHVARAHATAVDARSAA